MLVELPADPFDLIGADPSAHRARDVRVEAEAEPVPRAEGEGDPVGAVERDPVVERGPQHRAVVVVAGEQPEAVEEGLEQLPHGRVRLGQLVVRVIAGHDDVVGTQTRLLHVREHVLQELARRNAEEPLVGVGERVQVAELQDPRRRHRGARSVRPGCRNRLQPTALHLDGRLTRRSSGR